MESSIVWSSSLLIYLISIVQFRHLSSQLPWVVRSEIEAQFKKSVDIKMPSAVAYRNYRGIEANRRVTYKELFSIGSYVTMVADRFWSPITFKAQPQLPLTMASVEPMNLKQKFQPGLGYNVAYVLLKNFYATFGNISALEPIM
jgi:hypothetical protein